MNNWTDLSPAPLSEVLARITPQDCPGNPERYLQACEEAAAHALALRTEHLHPQERKYEMLREGVRFRNEWFKAA